jgi:hypothetical protein
MNSLINLLLCVFCILSVKPFNSQCVVNITTNSTLLDPSATYLKNKMEPLFNSTVPIKINIVLTNNLGSTSGVSLGITLSGGNKNFINAPFTNTWYNSSLANSIANTELNPGEVDFEVFLNQNINWYYDTNSNIPSNQYNLLETILHEVVHGLGIYSTSLGENLNGSFGEIDGNWFSGFNPTVTLPALEGLPSVYDRFIINGNNQYISDTNLFTNVSSNLFNQFTSNDLYFSGMKSKYINKNIAFPKVYADQSYQFGTSVFHLDNDTNYTSPNLITPYEEDFGEFIDFDNLTLAVLADIGWSINSTILSVGEVNKNIGYEIYPNPSSDIIKIKNLTPTDNLLVRNIRGKEVTEEISFNEDKSINIKHLDNGIYIVTILSSSNIYTGKFIKN